MLVIGQGNRTVDSLCVCVCVLVDNKRHVYPVVAHFTKSTTVVIWL